MDHFNFKLYTYMKYTLTCKSNFIYLSKVDKRFYSSKSTFSKLPYINTVPVLVLYKLADKSYINSFIDTLKDKRGIYSFINTVNGKQYIGSAKDLYLRLNEHLNNKKSNLLLQAAFDKYGLDKFNWIIYKYFTYESKIISHKSLTELETYYISIFDFNTLYNFSTLAHNNLGYKHTEESKLKISKPGKLNPMYAKSHTLETKNLISIKISKYPLGGRTLWYWLQFN
uniref:GIY-YIG homing endonuclease n=1 Tax=Ophiostoma novo-ulmi subsp. novo-ulmi TaxID=170179 RepID=A0A2L1IPW5_OPHNO|nr:GIY-YIG homing endonuclease [Ophiostoma novo-ulmi subsp. novo-ulmi]